MRIRRCAALLLSLVVLLAAGCGGKTAPVPQSAAESAASEAAAQAESAAESALTPDPAGGITASQIRDGEYEITVTSSASMFRVVAARLIVEGDSMHCVMTLSGVGYGKLFMGTKEEARQADESAYIPFVKDEEGWYTYDCPIEALDRDTNCAAWSIKNKKWYDRVLVYQSADLPPDALEGK